MFPSYTLDILLTLLLQLCNSFSIGELSFGVNILASNRPQMRFWMFGFLLRLVGKMPFGNQELHIAIKIKTFRLARLTFGTE